MPSQISTSTCAQWECQLVRSYMLLDIEATANSLITKNLVKVDKHPALLEDAVKSATPHPSKQGGFHMKHWLGSQSQVLCRCWKQTT